MEQAKTPLYREHIALKAKMVDFAGYLMPVEYTGLIEEHLRVRSACGIFDVSHMGEIEVTGRGALAAVNLVATNDASRIKDNQCQYTLVCNADGGVVDDVIVYRFNAERFLFCVNVSNTDKAFEWISRQANADAVVRNVSPDYAQIALQGPKSVEVLKAIADIDPGAIKRYHFTVGEVANISAIISRTGYTGEDGFEIYLSPLGAPAVWKAALEAGTGFGILPVGLGARDTLRLEMGYPLYGHELTDITTPLEAGLERFVALNKNEFIGKDALKRGFAAGPEKRLIGFNMLKPGIPRQGYDIMVNDKKAGSVTSGTYSPMLRAGIGMGYAASGLIKDIEENGSGLKIMIRGRPSEARMVKPPFYKKEALTC